MVDRISLPATPAPAAPAPTAPAADVTVRQGAPDARSFGRIEATPAPASGAPAAPAGGEQRPAWLPEKFQSPEALAQAYQALEQRLGAAGNLPAPAAQPAPGAPVPAPAAPQGASDLVQKMTQEWAATGQVSPAMRQEFQQRTGLDPAFIDSQIAHLEAQNSRAYEMATKRLGGEAAVSELTEWAKARLSQEDRETFNRAVYSGDQRLAQLAMDGLAARYEAEVGRAPRVMAGRKPVPEVGGLTAFQSNAEWQAARRDPKYKQDPAYRQLVEDRLRLSARMGIL